MGPMGHAVISAAVGGGVWTATGSEGAAALAVGAGVLMDVDHLYDYYQWYVRGRADKIHVFLHGWEYSLAGLTALAAGINHPFLWAAALAHLAHLCSDQLFNAVSPLGYSIIYRWVKEFDIAKVAPHLDVTTEYRKLHRMLPFSRRWEPWFDARVYPGLARRLNQGGGAGDR